MAKGTGIYGAYRGARPIAQDFGDDLLQHENMQFQHRAEQRLIDDREAAKKKSLNDKIINAQKALKPDYTGIKSEDEKRGALVLQAADMLNEAKKKLEENPNDIDANMTVANLEDFANRFAAMTENYTGWMNDGVTGLADGKYSPYLNRNQIGNIEKVIDGQVNYGLDAKGNITGSYDKDGDGTPDFSWHGMATGVDLEPYKQRFDSDAFKATLKKQYGTEHTKQPDGTYTTREIEQLPQASKAQIRDGIERMFGSDVDNVTDTGLSYIYDELGVDYETPLTPELLKQAKNQLYLESLAMWDTKDFQVKNWQDENADQNRNLQWWKANQQGKGDDKEQKELNNLRTFVTGLAQGDSEALGVLKTTSISRPNKEGKGFVEVGVNNADYVGNELVIELDNGEVLKFDRNDAETFNGSVASIIRPDYPAEKVMQVFDRGQITRPLGSVSQTRDKSLADFRQEMNSVKDANSWYNSYAHSYSNYINDNYKDVGFSSKKDGRDNIVVTNSNGDKKTFNVNTKEGRAELGTWLYENTTSIKFEAPKSTSNSSETPTIDTSKYNTPND